MKLAKWKFISRKQLLRHPRMQVVEDKVELPGGKLTDYLRLAPTKNHSVAVLAFNHKGELLLQREYSYPPDQILWQLPGGGMFDDETVEQAANRELSEESGFGAHNVQQLGFFYVSNRRSDQKQFVVICNDLYEHKIDGDPEEFIESHWLPLSKVQDMTARGEFYNINLLAALNLYFAQK